MGKSDYLEDALLDHRYGGPDYSRPATVWVALFSSDPTDDGSGTELSAGDYARASVTNNDTNWPAASGGSKSNGTIIDFGTAGVADWAPAGTPATHFGIFDAATAGNLLDHGALSSSKTIEVGDPVSFPIGSLTITEA